MNNHVKNFLLLFLAVVVSLVLLEAGGRLVFEPVSRVNFTSLPRSIIMPPTIAGVPYMLKPGGIGKQEFGSNPDNYFDEGSTLTYRINSLGLRGREITREKSKTTFRIAVMGDSFTFGSGVRLEHTLPSILEAQLADKHGTKNIEVLNFGVGGYNTDHEVNLLERFALQFDPDLVVIVFFLNDTNAGGTAQAFHTWVPEDQLPFWRRHSRIADMLANGFERKLAAQKMVEEYRASYRDTAAGWVKSRKALKQAALLSRFKDFELALVIYPVLWNLSEDYPFLEIHRTISGFAAAKGIPVLDLLPAFSGFNGPELWAHPNNQHPNPQANLLAASAVADFLVSTYPYLTAGP